MTQKVLGNAEKGKLFVISAPAGSGKTTLSRMLTSEFNCVVESVSYTTRQPRLGEVDGKDYFFVSKEVFKELEALGHFIETAHVFGNDYGTSKTFITDHQQKGQHVLLVIDVQGAMKLQEMKLDAVYVFIKPPSMLALKERLVMRKTDSHESIEKRLAMAQEEMNHVKFYDYVIINDNLASAYEALRAILIAEEHKI
jgi:guanylate kinase